MQILADLRSVKNRLLQQLKHKGTKAKSLEGGINAFISIAKMIGDITGEFGPKARSVHMEKIALVVFKVLADAD